MNNEFKQIKDFLLAELSKKYSSPTIALWFEPLKIAKLTGKTLYVSLPQNRKNFVETQYFEVLRETFSQIIGTDIRLKIITEEEEAEVLGEEEHVSAYQTRFNPEYTFDNFVVGKSNQLAQSASLAVANHPFDLNNPLFLYGPSGLGKTHLLFSIVNKIRENHPEYNILYVTGEEFTNELVEALTFKRPVAFREKYRNLDVLLVDDIQFISGKLSVQEEFFHTFDSLFKMNKQIIIASDRAPNEIGNLEDRLKSRFVMGLVADIQPPDLELRVAIFKRKAMDFGYNIDMDILYYLANNITTNIRQIEGALKKLRAHSLITGKECDYKMAQEVLSEFFSSAKSEEAIIDRVFDYAKKRYGVDKEDIIGTRRSADILLARHYTIYLLRKSTNLSQKSIAKIFNRDHTTIINSISVIERKMKMDESFANEIKAIIKELS